MKEHKQNMEIQIKNGGEVEGLPGWCALCNYSFGGSMTVRRAKYLNGKFYHLHCYPKAVEIYLADLKLQQALSPQKMAPHCPPM